MALMQEVRLSLSYDKSAASSVGKPIEVRQGDRNAVRLAFRAATYDEGQGVEAYFNCLRPDRSFVRQRAEISGAGDDVQEVSFTVTPEASAVPGPFPAYFTIEKGGEVVQSTCDFPMMSHPSATGSGRLPVESWSDEYAELLAALEAQRERQQESWEEQTGRQQSEWSEQYASQREAFAEMEQRSKGWLRYYCGQGEYDPVTMRPTVADPDTATMYLVPRAPSDTGYRFNAWFWSTETDGWESFASPLPILPITEEQIDEIVEAGAPPQAGAEERALTVSGLSYLWDRIKAAFAAKVHTHGNSDITSLSGAKLTNATVSRLKLDASLAQDIADLEARSQTVLYANMTGTTGTVTLSESAANFGYLRILYRDNDWMKKSVDVHGPDGAYANLDGWMKSGSIAGAFWGKMRAVLVSGKTITNVGTRYGCVQISGASNAVYPDDNNTNSIYITAVIGYRA